jgi:hypothetical protein
MDKTYYIEWIFGQTRTNGTYCQISSVSRISENVTRRIYKSSNEKHLTDNYINNRASPCLIEMIPINTGERKKYKFSNANQYSFVYNNNDNIFTWELHSDDGSGHFIVRLYRELGYVELEVIEELNFLC